MKRSGSPKTSPSSDDSPSGAICAWAGRAGRTNKQVRSRSPRADLGCIFIEIAASMQRDEKISTLSKFFQRLVVDFGEVVSEHPAYDGTTTSMFPRWQHRMCQSR